MKIKGFDKDLKCRGMQFEVGKEYKIESNREPELCTDTVFHYCDSLQKVHQFYSALPEKGNRFCEIEAIGKEVSDGEKCGCSHIKIIREIIGEELDICRGLINGNTGLFNSGNCNSGGWNKSSRETGFFNTHELKIINVFNKPCDIELWNSSIKPSFIYFDLVEFIIYENMTDEEKLIHPEAKTCNGYLKKLDYKEAFQKSYNDLSEEERINQTALLKALPNFDADIFFEISGIRIE